MLAKKTLEINPNHPVMKVMLERLKEHDGQLNEAETEYADLLYQMALINSGFSNDEPTELTNPLEKLIRVGFGVGREDPIVEIEVQIDEEPEQEPEQDSEASAGIPYEDEL